VQARAQRIGWARLFKRVFDIDMRRCSSCSAGELKIIAAILERATIGKILTHLGLDRGPPPRSKARERLREAMPGAMKQESVRGTLTRHGMTPNARDGAAFAA